MLQYLLPAVTRVPTYEHKRSNLQSQASKGTKKVYSLQLRNL